MNYEPAPVFGCKHKWKLIGKPINVWWVINMPLMQKQKCLKCGGVGWVKVKRGK